MEKLVGGIAKGHSEVYQLMRDGVSDMHCMSDAYLADELEQEYQTKQ